MYPVYSIIRALKRISKRTEKTALLKQNVDNQQLKRVFNLALNPNYNFGILQVDTIEGAKGVVPLEQGLDFLEFKLNTRAVTGNQARQELKELLQGMSKVDQEIILDILNRNLDCGVSTATVNSVWPNLIETSQFMLASTDATSLNFPNVICQVKYDGMRVQAIRNGDSIQLITRNTSKINCPSHLTSEIQQLLHEYEFLDGELLYFAEEDSAAIRQQGNGILNKVIQGTATPEEVSKIRFVVWDLVDSSNNVPYRTRLETLTSRINTNKPSHVQLVEGILTQDLSELTVYFKQQLSKGHEGIVAKNLSSIWQPKRSKDWVKFKDIKTADLKVIKLIPGSGKYVGKLGALELSSEDGKVIVSVGTGFSDAQRELLNHPRVLNQIVEVAYNNRISSKGKVDSLYLPRFIRFRSDEKTVADSSEEIQ